MKVSPILHRRTIRTGIMFAGLTLIAVLFLASINGEASGRCHRDQDCPKEGACLPSGLCSERTISKNYSHPTKNNSQKPKFIIAEAPSKPWPCRAILDCPESTTCNLSSGMCERRAERLEHELAIYSVYPNVVTPGDVVVVDGGQLFMARVLDPSDLINGQKVLTQILLNGQPITLPDALKLDETRFSFPAPRQGGILTVRFDETDKSFNAPVPLTVLPETSGMWECQANNPEPPKFTAVRPSEIGPYGAGFVDPHSKSDPFLRIYYPAKCGGLRTPPGKGAFPWLLLMPGNGANAFNYEYLARHLASWGYIVIAPTIREIDKLVQLVKDVEKSPSQLHPILGQILIKEKFGIIGHSRGAERAAKILEKYPKLFVKAIVMLAPVTEQYTIKLKFPSLFIASSEDRQAFPNAVRESWEAQPAPKYAALLVGGNHSQFTDSKHWEGTAVDGDPKISRNRQLVLTQSLILAFLQERFKRTPKFSQWLNETTVPTDVDLIYHSGKLSLVIP